MGQEPDPASARAAIIKSLFRRDGPTDHGELVSHVIFLLVLAFSSPAESTDKLTSRRALCPGLVSTQFQVSHLRVNEEVRQDCGSLGNGRGCPL